jgi:diacylglycerol kinase family enzyme
LRALLVFNPNATTTDDNVRDVIASALASQVDLEVQPTKQRGHATHIVAGAVHEGVDVVFSLGGDGTVNEVIQALAGTKVRLGTIPGGGANVFARALGLPNDAVAATAIMLDKLRSDQYRTIGLGRANGRYFGFNAGFGFDAAVVRLVEQSPALKRRFRQAAFVWLALQEWARNHDRRDPQIGLSIGDGPTTGAYGICVVGNTDPYTFLGPRPLHVTPDATFESGLDLVAIRRVNTTTLLRLLAGIFTSGGHLDHPSVDVHRDLDRFTLVTPRPQPLMVDGDYAGEHTEVVMEAVRGALHVLA